MKRLFIWLASGGGLIGLVACGPVPSNFSSPSNPPFMTTNTLQSQNAVIDKAVVAALAQRYEVPVIIELRSSPTSSDEERVRQVQMIQDLVLSTLAPDEFRLKYKYSTSFSMAGWVTEQGVFKLGSNLHVVKVSLDGLSRTSTN